MTSLHVAQNAESTCSGLNCGIYSAFFGIASNEYARLELSHDNGALDVQLAITYAAAIGITLS